MPGWNGSPLARLPFFSGEDRLTNHFPVMFVFGRYECCIFLFRLFRHSPGDQNFPAKYKMRAPCRSGRQTWRDPYLEIRSTTGVDPIHAFDAELILLQYRVMGNWQIMLPDVLDYVTRYAWALWGKVRVAKAQPCLEAAVLGAVPMLADWTSTETHQDKRNVR